MFELYSFKDNIACITPSGDQLSYGELQVLSDHIKAHIDSHELVFCLCGNTIGSRAGYVTFMNNDTATLLLDAQIE